MRGKKAVRWGFMVFLVAILVVSATAGTLASPPAQDPQTEDQWGIDSVVCGDDISCHTGGASVSIQNSGSGNALFVKNTSGSGAIKARGQPAIFGYSDSGAAIRGVSVNKEGVKGKSTYQYGVYGESPNGTGVFGTTDEWSGVYGESLTVDWADNGVFGWTESENSTAEAGVFGYNAGDVADTSGPGVYGYGNAPNTGFGVRGYSNNSHAVYGDSNSTTYYAYGGWFSGAAGVYGNAETSGGDAVFANCYAGGACWGVRAYSDSSRAVYASTDNTSHDWGLYTPDDVSALGYYYYKGLSFFAQNGGDIELQPGDLVVVVGMGAPLPDSDVPVMLVRRADVASGSGIVGVVDKAVQFTTVTKPGATYELTEVPDLEGGEPDHVYLAQPGERQYTETSKVDGPVAPGGVMVLMVQGLVRMKVDASAGAIQAGDLLMAGDGGFALKAQPVSIEGQAPFFSAGSIVGKALEPLTEGQGIIWVLVDLR